MITRLICAVLGFVLGWTLGCATEYVVDHIQIPVNANSKEPKQIDPVIKGLLKMKNDFGGNGIAYFIVDNKKYSLDELLYELENHTEVGQKFRENINEMILAYLMKFRGED